MKSRTGYNSVTVKSNLGHGGKVERWSTRYEGHVLQFWAAVSVPSPDPVDNWVEFHIGSSALRDFYAVLHPTGSVFVGRADTTHDTVRFSFGPGTHDLRVGWNILVGTGF